jgi:anti-anti-sigma factor
MNAGGLVFGSSLVADMDRVQSLLRLQGEYDLTRKDEIATLFESIDSGEPLAIDMTGVTYIDSTMLSELARLRLRQKHRTITLAGANAHVRRVLAIAKFDKIFHVTD